MKAFLTVVVVNTMVMTGLGVFIAMRMPVPHNAPFLTTQDDWSLFAEVFGSIGGTLFAGLAFAGLIWTIRIQQRELRETRGELANAVKAQNAHVETAKQTAKLSALAALFADTSRSAQFLGPRYIGSEEGKEMLEELSKLRSQIEAELLGLSSDPRD